MNYKRLFEFERSPVLNTAKDIYSVAQPPIRRGYDGTINALQGLGNHLVEDGGSHIALRVISYGAFVVGLGMTAISFGHDIYSDLTNTNNGWSTLMLDWFPFGLKIGALGLAGTVVDQAITFAERVERLEEKVKQYEETTAQK